MEAAGFDFVDTQSSMAGIMKYCRSSQLRHHSLTGWLGKLALFSGCLLLTASCAKYTADPAILLFLRSPGIQLTESGGSTDVTEGGATDTYTIALTEMPVADVTVTIVPDAQTTVTPSRIAFTSSDWMIPKTITVTAVDDTLPEGNHTSTIKHRVTSIDPLFTVPSRSLTANVTDNDGMGFQLTETGGTTDVTEGGATDTYSIVLLGTPPAANVTVTIATDGQTSVLPTTLTFTPANWNTPQTVTVTAVDDLVAEGMHTSTITHTINTGAITYVPALSLPNVTANIRDNDISPKGSVQSGSVQFNAGAGGTVSGTNTETVTLGTAVTMSRAFVLCSFDLDASGVENYPTCQLTATNQVTITIGQVNGRVANVRWQVVEFAAGATVQRGTVSWTGGAATQTLQNVAITAVNPANAFVIVTARTPSSTNNNDDQIVKVMGRLTTTTNLELSRYDNANDAVIEWQVVELAGAAVESGQTTLGAGTGSASFTLATPVDTTRTFLISNYKGTAAIAGVDGDLYVRGALSSTAVTFTRDSTAGQVDVSWFVVAMGNTTTVQSGSVLANAMVSSVTNVTLGTAVNTATAVPLYSASVVPTSPGSNFEMDNVNVTPSFTSTTNLKFTCNSQNGPAPPTIDVTIDWFVIEFM